jgi:hypothetical protein
VLTLVWLFHLESFYSTRYCIYSNARPGFSLKYSALLEKMEVLHVLDRRMSTVAFKHHYGVSNSAVCYIKHIENKIRGNIKAVGAQSVKRSCVNFHDPFLEKIEVHSNLLTTNSYHLISFNTA